MYDVRGYWYKDNKTLLVIKQFKNSGKQALPSEMLPKNCGRRNTFKLVLWGHRYPDAKIRQRYNKKWKSQASITDAAAAAPLMNIDVKMLSKMLANRIQQCVKDHTPWSSGVYPRDAKNFLIYVGHQCDTPGVPNLQAVDQHFLSDQQQH